MKTKNSLFLFPLISLFFYCSGPKNNLENTQPFTDSAKTEKLTPESPKTLDTLIETPETEKPIINSEFQLVIVDSVLIQNTGILSLLAIHPTKDLFLIMEGVMGEKLLIYNRKGEVLDELKKPKDAPDGYGGVCSGATFSGDAIFVQGLQGIYEFDFQLNLKNKYPKPFLGNTIMAAGDNIAHAKLQGNNGLLLFTGSAKNNHPKNSPLHFEEFNSLEWLDLQKKELKPILPLLPNSYLLQAKSSFNNYMTYFKVKGSRLIYCYNLEPSIYTANLSQNPIKPTRIPLPIKDFIYDKGYPFGSQKEIEDRITLPGSIKGIYKADDMDLIVYNKGLEKDRFPEGVQDRYELRKEVNRRNPEYWILYSKTGEFSEEKPIGSQYKIVRSDANGRIWAIQNVDNLDLEPEGFIIYELALK
ncbi:hypothetical protein [Algoriphagus taiwanensis]|uniref:6-bladed beta-propeller protein n=1 Tax=Algoriphagus taiwanensis TaxID=1445656 RepID=A0ABQ6Q544_9BACT|nr:hypothetical protein Ataiwa_29630 [Algoriphagus taiwanensis]